MAPQQLRVIKDSAATSTALDLGATVLSWQPQGFEEVLFVSRNASFDPGVEIHGGIPICAPWFGRGRSGTQVPHLHGLVRWVPWRLTAHGRNTLSWELSARDFSQLPGAEDYPPDLKFSLTAQFGAELGLQLTTLSPTTEFVLDHAFHTYLRVRDFTQCEILGLAGAEFRDYTGSGLVQRENQQLRPRGALDRVYRNSLPVELHDGGRVIEVTGRGANSVVIWNPGPVYTPEGMAQDEWRSMVCIEVGNVQDQAVVVPAGGSHQLGLQLRVRNAVDRKAEPSPGSFGPAEPPCRQRTHNTRPKAAFTIDPESR